MSQLHHSIQNFLQVIGSGERIAIDRTEHIKNIVFRQQIVSASLDIEAMDQSIAAFQNRRLDEQIALVKLRDIVGRDSLSLVKRLRHENEHACIDIGLVEEKHIRVVVDLILKLLGQCESRVNEGFDAGTTEVLDGRPELQSIECLGANARSDLSQGPLGLQDKIRVGRDVCERLGILE